mmetsp:Transcript_78986/g.199370  ORF Transcript_78986/g.199370 Transcript_78986/m.199370 type:complete len:546 (-) Transcript_78986:82-1719(-)
MAVPAWTARRSCRKAFVALMLGSTSHEVVGQSHYASLANVPKGCYSYGYQHTPEMPNVTGQPFIMGSAMLCQQRCAATPGCAAFGYWTTNKECWLGGADSVIIVSQSLGVITGPARCHNATPQCGAIPGPSFPGATPAESRAAWQVGQQPANLQCWPRKTNGFPATCENQTATVLQDTMTGWPGRCEGLMKITNLGPTETCQSRCFGTPLCGVWAVENTTSGDGTLTCWQGMFGQNCYDTSNGLSPPEGAFFRSQRVMHGTFRVLMNTANMQIKNLTKAFGIEMHPDWKEGAKACRMTCLSYLLCQFWQYSSVYGCWVEDDMSATIAYPLVNDGTEMNVGSYSALTVKAGEYIQHTCKAGVKEPLPTDPPYMVHTGGTTRHPAVPKYGVIETTPMPRHHVEAVQGYQEEPFPLWATMLICLTIALCLGVAGAAIWMTLLDSDKMGSQGALLSPANSRSQSFDSQASQSPLVGGHGGGLWGFGHQMYQNLHFGGGGHAGYPPVPHPPPYGHPGMQQPYPGYPPAMGTQQGYGHDQLMQYAHQGAGY